MVDRPKPDPDIYLKVIEDTKIEPSDTVILEDSTLLEFNAAVAAKIKVIGVTSGGALGWPFITCSSIGCRCKCCC